jgi:stress-induced morphogen
MSVTIVRGKSDQMLESLQQALEAFQQEHPQAQIDLYRRNEVSIRVRIIDPEFDGLSLAARSDVVWRYLDALSDDVVGDISSMVLLTPDESAKSFANFNFENPLPIEV